MVRLLLVRHGESMANRRDMEQVQLMATGMSREQARAVAPSLSGGEEV